MTKTYKKQFDLEDRTLDFAQRCRDYIKSLPKTITNIEYSKQLARSSASQGSNYIEANEAISKKDFSHRIKICRKESKESRFFLILTEPLEEKVDEQNALIKEATELMKIFNSIVVKSS